MVCIGKQNRKLGEGLSCPLSAFHSLDLSLSLPLSLPPLPPQDIFECRTCGLTGSLCCCTECALTCHRNHECRLKKTSPTAYCDCWEKACCKALVRREEGGERREGGGRRRGEEGGGEREGGGGDRFPRWRATNRPARSC